MGANLATFYGNILDEHDADERIKKTATVANTKKMRTSNGDEQNGESSFSLRNLRTDFANLQTNYKPSGSGGVSHSRGSSDHNTRVNKEYLNRPLKASERLKYVQRNSGQDSEHKIQQQPSADEKVRKPHSPIQKSGSQQINRNDARRSDVSLINPELESTEPPLQEITRNAQDSVQPDSITSSSSDARTVSEPPKYESTFNWFEAVENVTNDQYLNHNNFNTSEDINSKFDTLSLASYSSNPVSPNEQDEAGATSPRSFRNRSRRNSLNRFRSEFYKQSNESLNQQQDFDRRSVGRNNNNRPGNSHHQNSNYNNQHNWRSSGRNSPRNGYHRRGGAGGGGGGGSNADYDRDGRDSNNFRRNLSRGGSVDSNIKDFQHGPVGNRNRHDSFNRRNQENDNFEHFHSYNRKSYSRNKDSFTNNSKLPPRLQLAQQQKMAQLKLQQQQQQQQFNNDCDNPKRFSNKNNQTSSTSGTASNKGKYSAKDQSARCESSTTCTGGDAVQPPPTDKREN